MNDQVANGGDPLDNDEDPLNNGNVVDGDDRATSPPTAQNNSDRRVPSPAPSDQHGSDGGDDQDNVSFVTSPQHYRNHRRRSASIMRPPESDGEDER